MDEYSCDEILHELASRFVNTNGIEFCDKQVLMDISNEIVEYLLGLKQDGED